MRINDNGIDRDMTAEEEKSHMAAAAAIQQERAARNTIIAADTATLRSAITKLKATGLTAAEITALTGRIDVRNV